MSGEITNNNSNEPTYPSTADEPAVDENQGGSADPADVSDVSDDKSLEDLLAEKEAEAEGLRKLVHERNKEAAQKRVRAREAEQEALTLREQVQKLTQRAEKADRDAALNRALAEHGLTAAHAPYLGDDTEKFGELAGNLKKLLGVSDTTGAQSSEPKPVGVERLKGGLNPTDPANAFDPSKIISRHRNRR